MRSSIYGTIYAQERNGEPFIIDVEIIEDNWDFRKSCYQQYELNAWAKKINGERRLLLSTKNDATLSYSLKEVKSFIKDIKDCCVKHHYKVLTEREYKLVYKAYYFD